MPDLIWFLSHTANGGGAAHSGRRITKEESPATAYPPPFSYPPVGLLALEFRKTCSHTPDLCVSL